MDFADTGPVIAAEGHSPRGDALTVAEEPAPSLHTQSWSSERDLTCVQPKKDKELRANKPARTRLVQVERQCGALGL